MKKTPWFPFSIKPVRKGWYEVNECPGFMDCAGMHYWDGKAWCFPEHTPITEYTSAAKRPWRGLTEKPQ